MFDYQEEFRKFWEHYILIYESQKRIYMLAEEYDKEFSSFLQPIKEQKDSLDHIARAYKQYYNTEDLYNGIDSVFDNLNKAIGHIFRAYYDSVDFLGIILRERISSNICNFTYPQIVSVWKDYEIYRKKLIEFPEKMTNLKLNKGIDKSSDEIKQRIKDYQKLIDELLEIFKIFMIDVYPKLCQKYL